MAKKRVMTKFKLDEVSFVRKPAQGLATADIMKSGEVTAEDMEGMDTSDLLVEDGVMAGAFEDLTKSMVDMATSVEDGHQHGVRVTHYDDGRAHVHLGYAGGDEREHSHEVMMNPDGSVTVTENFGHSHDIDATELRNLMLAILTKTGFEIPKQADIADLLSMWDQSGDETLEKDAGTMADQNTKAATDLKAAQDALTKSQGEVTTLTSDLEKANQLAAMNDAEKAFMAKLDKEDEKDKFRMASKKERIAQMAKADDADPVVYKSEIDGTEFRKSDDPRLVEMAKRDDAREAEMKKLRDENADAGFKKTAETTLSNLPGDLEVRVAIAKAIDGIEDEAMRKKAYESLSAKNVAAGKTTTTLGRDGITKGDADDVDLMKRDDAADELDRLTEEVMKADPKMSHEDAYEKACEDNPKVYKAAISGAY